MSHLDLWDSRVPERPSVRWELCDDCAAIAVAVVAQLMNPTGCENYVGPDATGVAPGGPAEVKKHDIEIFIDRLVAP